MNEQSTKRTYALIASSLLLMLSAGEAGAQTVSAEELLRLAMSQEHHLIQMESDLPVKCGFPAIITALVSGGYAATGAQVQRPQLPSPQTYTSPGGAFLLHFTAIGLDSVPSADLNTNSVPDYIETAAAAFDSVRQGYINLGWRNPPSDGSLYDVYFMDIDPFYIFGYTQPVEPFTVTPPYTAPSFIVLDNDYPEFIFGHDPLESLRITIAHEYHHSIQLGYSLAYIDVEEYQKFAWFAEATAVYHEEVFYDGINDYYYYLPSFLNAPDLSLTADWSAGNHMYGAVLWTLYLAHKYGPAVNPLLEIWTLMADEPVRPLEAHRLFLEGQGSSLLESYGEFSTWLLHTGDRDVPGSYYEEGANYAEVHIESGDPGGDELSLPPLAVKYFRSGAGSQEGGLALRLTPLQESEWGAGVAGETGNTLSGVKISVNPDADQKLGAGVELLDMNTYDFVLQWSLTGDNFGVGTDLALNRTAEIENIRSTRLSTTSVGAGALIVHQNYPNPFRPDTHTETYFSFSLGSDGDVDLEIRSLSGIVVWSNTFPGLSAGQQFTDELGVGWNGEDSSGTKMPSGVYLLIVKAGGATGTVKFSLIR